MGTLTPHLVTRDPAAALRFGDGKLAIGNEFPDLGIVSPVTLGGTYWALHLAVGAAGTIWQRALNAGRCGDRRQCRHQQHK